MGSHCCGFSGTENRAVAGFPGPQGVAGGSDLEAECTPPGSLAGAPELDGDPSGCAGRWAAAWELVELDGEALPCGAWPHSSLCYSEIGPSALAVRWRDAFWHPRCFLRALGAAVASVAGELERRCGSQSGWAEQHRVAFMLAISELGMAGLVRRVRR